MKQTLDLTKLTYYRRFRLLRLSHDTVSSYLALTEGKSIKASTIDDLLLAIDSWHDAGDQQQPQVQGYESTTAGKEPF